MYKEINLAVKSIQFDSNRMMHIDLILWHYLCDTVLNGHAPAEDKSDDTKFEELEYT
jgi:hypothetical protein